MKEIAETLPETDDFTQTCGVGECFHCGITREVSECKHCEVIICNECRPDHMFSSSEGHR